MTNLLHHGSTHGGTWSWCADHLGLVPGELRLDTDGLHSKHHLSKTTGLGRPCRERPLNIHVDAYITDLQLLQGQSRGACRSATSTQRFSPTSSSPSSCTGTFVPFCSLLVGGSLRVGEARPGLPSVLARAGSRIVRMKVYAIQTRLRKSIDEGNIEKEVDDGETFRHGSRK